MQKLNLPNKLTLIRMFLAPIYLALMLIEFPYHYIVALAVFSVASLTDMLDGKIARKNNLITVFGKLLDPLADKMLTTAALLAFMREGWCSIWIVMIVLTREFAVAGVRLIATAQGIVIPANYWGKAKPSARWCSLLLSCSSPSLTRRLIFSQTPAGSLSRECRISCSG